MPWPPCKPGPCTFSQGISYYTLFSPTKPCSSMTHLTDLHGEFVGAIGADESVEANFKVRVVLRACTFMHARRG